MGRAAGRVHPGRPRDGAGRAAGLRPSPDHRPGARGRLADRACRDRRARARHSGRRPGRGRGEPDRDRRHRHRRWRSRASPDPAERGHSAIGGGGGRGANPPARALRQPAHRPGDDARRGRDQAAAECRAADRPAAIGGNRRRRRRAVPHRDPVHGARHLSRGRRPDRILPPRLRAGGRAAGRVPHARYRRRQAAALSAACGRGQPGDGLAGDPHRARPAGDAAPAAARLGARRRGPRPARSSSR